MPIYAWSRTAADNDDADIASGINWQEGQAPSTVNDTGRASMTEIAEWRDDISGTLTTAGTSTAYTVTNNGSFTTLADGVTLSVTANVTCGASATLNVNGLGAKKLRKFTGGSEADVAAGDLVANGHYLLQYDSAANASAGAWIVLNPTVAVPSIPDAMPVGMIVPYAGTSAPSKFLFCFGQNVSRTTYSALFTALGTTYGSGDGSTTFTLPDLRGRVVAGKDDMGGSAASRLTNSGTGNPGIAGATLGAAGGADRHTLTTAQMPSHNHGLLRTGTLTGGGSDAMSQSAQNTNSTTTQNTGGGEAHPIVQPTIVLNFIVYAGV
jgi:microcystin-dependent protein